MSRRLIIRPGAIGDCILCFPAMEHLRAAYTEVWAPSVVLPLIQFADSTHSLISTGIDLLGVGDLRPPKEFFERVRAFDSIVSWYGSNRSEFRAALTAVNPRCEFHAALPRDFSQHVIDFYAQQVGAPIGLVPQIRVAAETRDAVVIHPFSGSRKKNWPLDCFRQVAAELPLAVDWLAGPDEILPEAKRFDNLLDLARFVSGSQLYIGNDSGITHLAAATGVRTLAIFGSASPRIWVPRGQNVEVVAVSDLADLKPSFLKRLVNRLLDSPFS